MNIFILLHCIRLCYSNIWGCRITCRFGFCMF